MAEDRQDKAPRRAQVEDADYVPTGDGPNVPRVRQTAGDGRAFSLGLALFMLVILLMICAVTRAGGRAGEAAVNRASPAGFTAAAAERHVPAESDAVLGAETRTVTEPVAAYYTRKDSPAVPGAQVCFLDEKGAAALAGVETGDVITALGGEEIRSAEALRGALEDFAPGDEVEITVFRAGEYLTLTAEIPPPGP